MLNKENIKSTGVWLQSSVVWLCLLCMPTSQLFAEPGFKIESAKIYESANNYYLNASIDHKMHPEAYEILAKGLPIYIQFELEIYKPRRYWLDRTMLEKEYSYRLQHDPITDQYELTRGDTDLTLSYASAEQAVESLHYLSNLFIVETKNIASANEAVVQLRMNLDVRNFPDPLQYLSQYWGDWVRTTEWHRWSLLDPEEQTVVKSIDKSLAKASSTDTVQGEKILVPEEKGQKQEALDKQAEPEQGSPEEQQKEDDR